MIGTFISASQNFKVQWPASVANFCMATKTVFAIPYKEISSITFPRSSPLSIYQFKQLSLYSQVVCSSTSRTLSLSTLPVNISHEFHDCLKLFSCSIVFLWNCKSFLHLLSEFAIKRVKLYNVYNISIWKFDICNNIISNIESILKA